MSAKEKICKYDENVKCQLEHDCTYCYYYMEKILKEQNKEGEDADKS